jgi:peptide/nickel transport system permease protein
MTTGDANLNPALAVTTDHAPAAPPRADQPRREEPPPRRRSFLAQAMIDTFKNRRAKVSAVWIGLLVIGAVFSPLIANSHPLLLKQGGHWSSPLLRHLTPADVTLFVAFFAGLVLLPLRRVPHRVWIYFGVLFVGAVLSYFFVKPPETVVLSEYREAAKAGKIESAVYAPIPFSPTDRQRDIADPRLQEPNRQHWFGTDGYGQDVLSRIIHASRIALAIGFISTGIAVLIGIVVGGIMGYFVGRVDILGMRLIEIFEAIPTLFLLITIVAFFGRNLYLLMAIIGLTTWTGDARFIRAEFLRLRNQDFVQAARASGLPLRSIIFRHMLPNGVTPVLVSASFGVASAILLESTLSFLGLGLVEEPSWGGMLEQARNAGRFIWWLALYPGLAIFLTVFAYNLIGESMRDALDPKLRGIE